MLILTIRTDKPEAEIGLFEGSKELAYHTWQAHRQLASTIHSKTEELLKQHNKALDDLTGIVFFTGPGSFTGLRIGAATGNALGYSLSIKLVAEQGEDWIKKGIARLEQGKTDKILLPEYGAPAATTPPRK